MHFLKRQKCISKKAEVHFLERQECISKKAEVHFLKRQNQKGISKKAEGHFLERQERISKRQKCTSLKGRNLHFTPYKGKCARYEEHKCTFYVGLKCVSKIVIGKNTCASRASGLSKFLHFRKDFAVPGQYPQFTFLQWCCVLMVDVKSAVEDS